MLLLKKYILLSIAHSFFKCNHDQFSYLLFDSNVSETFCLVGMFPWRTAEFCESCMSAWMSRMESHCDMEIYLKSLNVSVEVKHLPSIKFTKSIGTLYL